MTLLVTGGRSPPHRARPGDPAELVASSARAKAELGWVPAEPDLHDIVADAWTFFRTRHPAT